MATGASGSSTFDANAFGKAVSRLIKRCGDIQQASSSLVLRLDSEQKNPITVQLNNYRKVYDKSKPEEHVSGFLQVYIKYREHILQGSDHMESWLTDNTLTIQFGDGKGITKNVRIPFSAIFDNAVKLRNNKQAQIDRMPAREASAEMERAQELIYPDTMLYYLFQALREAIRDSTYSLDGETMSRHIREMAINLGDTPSPSDSTPSFPSGFGQILSQVTSMFQASGVNIPSEVKQRIDSGNVEGLVSEALSQPGIGEIMQRAFSSLQNGGQGLDSLISGMLADQPPELSNAVNGLLGGLNIAASQEPVPAPPALKVEILEDEAGPSASTAEGADDEN